MTWREERKRIVIRLGKLAEVKERRNARQKSKQNESKLPPLKQEREAVITIGGGDKSNIPRRNKR